MRPSRACADARQAPQYGVSLPLIHILYADPLAALTEAVMRTGATWASTRRPTWPATPRVAGHDRVYIWNRCRRPTAAAQAGDQLCARAGRAPVHGHDPAREAPKIPTGVLMFVAPEGAEKVDAKAMRRAGSAASGRGGGR